MLYRKYRPQTFSEVVGQEHVVKTLKGAIMSGRIGHGYLFMGPRGTGKTTIARLLAKTLNCDKRTKDGDCDDFCDYCTAVNEARSLDLIEIDAASQTGVDNIRELTDSTMVAAPGGKYKVFIVDEVHMLSKSAFNALLKTLEEPPAHVVFILATTEPYKILPTVLSRVQRFDFKRLNQGQISEKLKMIAGKEGIKINDEAIKTIAMSADGALRDAEVALTKIRASVDPNKEVSAEDVNEILSLVSYKYYPEFLGCLLNNDS